jgi:hypothetical protein
MCLHIFTLLGGTARIGKRIPNDCGYDFFPKRALFPMIVCCFIFGGVHCIGWNFSYPSLEEKLLWRISCLLSMFLPPLITLTMYLFDWLASIHFNHYPSISAPFKTVASKLTYWRWENFCIVTCVAFLFVSCYILARVYLILEVFINLRSAPAECYQTVNWSKFLPHIA